MSSNNSGSSSGGYNLTGSCISTTRNSGSGSGTTSGTTGGSSSSSYNSSTSRHDSGYATGGGSASSSGGSSAGGSSGHQGSGGSLGGVRQSKYVGMEAEVAGRLHNTFSLPDIKFCCGMRVPTASALRSG
ncbi:hypothetical protein B0H65DRAFT_583459 [Neurospora tetraspora]|uniref:Uncharacterized protein n=1 Tax=Neurospora tetraspora TaxID=94610 RepID=A0AAE0J171_9PEZI|nr:hypothetical protein B0H65DRAFT_583459 [Neurospora tetraspora]